MTGRRWAALMSATLLAGVTVLAAAPAQAGDVPAPPASGHRASPPAEAVDVTGSWQSARKKILQTVIFKDDGTLSGNAGCNDFSGTYKVRSWFITISPLATTLKFCDDATMQAEQAFLARLQSATRADRQCSILLLDVSGGFMRLHYYVPPGKPPVTCAASGNARPFGNARP